MNTNAIHVQALAAQSERRQPLITESALTRRLYTPTASPSGRRHPVHGVTDFHSLASLQFRFKYIQVLTDVTFL